MNFVVLVFAMASVFQAMLPLSSGAADVHFSFAFRHHRCGGRCSSNFWPSTWLHTHTQYLFSSKVEHVTVEVKVAGNLVYEAEHTSHLKPGIFCLIFQSRKNENEQSHMPRYRTPCFAIVQMLVGIYVSTAGRSGRRYLHIRSRSSSSDSELGLRPLSRVAR